MGWRNQDLHAAAAAVVKDSRMVPRGKAPLDAGCNRGPVLPHTAYPPDGAAPHQYTVRLLSMLTAFGGLSGGDAHICPACDPPDDLAGVVPWRPTA